jgi:RTX calcium-binding nonapeptide repeat (4 copies)
MAIFHGTNGDDNNPPLTGGAGNDILNSGAGNDTVVGGKGDDLAHLGAGNDTFIWNPGDGNDTVAGGGGFDTLEFRGADRVQGEPTITIRATTNPDGSVVGATFDRPNGNIDLTSVERIQFDAQGAHTENITINDLTGTGVEQVAINVGAGADNITLNDVTGTDLKQVTIDLGADDQVDTVNINSTNGQAITFTEDNNGVVTVSGLANDLTISNFEDGVDQLEINGQIQPVAKGQTGTVTAVNSNNTGGTSTANDGSHATGLALLGQAMASSFVAAGDGHGGTPIADQPSSHQPLLTHPHA